MNDFKAYLDFSDMNDFKTYVINLLNSSKDYIINSDDIDDAIEEVVLEAQDIRDDLYDVVDEWRTACNI